MLRNKLTFVLSCFTNPKIAYQSLAHRQAKLLSWMVLFAILFSAAMLFVIFNFNPHNDPVVGRYTMFIGGLVLILISNYVLNCAGYYLVSAILFVACAAISPWISFLIDPSIFQGDFVPLTYVTLSALVSSILLPVYITVALATLQFIGITLVLLFSPASASFNWISLLAYVFSVSALSILKNSIVQHNIKRITLQASQLAQQKAILREQAIRDDLTNLFNRRYLAETLEHEIQRGISEKIPFGMIIVDVDNFKRINDTFGHATGDIVIQEVGNYLANHVRESDVACRYGGDEFILILPDTSPETTRGRAEQLRDGVIDLNLPVNITISLGIAVFPENGIDSDTLLKFADSALYQAKQRGGNCVVVAE